MSKLDKALAYAKTLPVKSVLLNNIILMVENELNGGVSKDAISISMPPLLSIVADKMNDTSIDINDLLFSIVNDNIINAGVFDTDFFRNIFINEEIPMNKHKLAEAHIATCPDFIDLFEKVLPDIGPGLILEFGAACVFGNTFKYICNAAKPRKVYGFDSFMGLPEDWILNVKKGAFLGRMMTETEMPENGEYVIGLIQNTLGPFLQQHAQEPLAFAHLDMDLYSSTSFALTTLIPHCRPGTVLVFDEISEGHFLEHEYKAFDEFLETTHYDIEVLGRRSTDAIGFRLV